MYCGAVFVMRILVVNHRDWLNPRAGGVEEVVFQTATRWVAAGHDVSLLCSDFPNSSGPDVILNGVKVFRRGREEYFNWVAPGIIQRQFGDTQVIVEQIAKVACFLPWRTRIPVVGYVHHLFGRSIYGNVSLPVAAYVHAMEKVAMKAYRRCPFIAVSHSTADDVASQGIPREQITVVHNGADLELFRPGTKTSYPSVLWVGRVRKTKCVDHVVKAFALVARQVPEARLTLVGRGEMEGEIQRMIAAEGLQDRVTMAGWLVTDKLCEQMQQAWVLTYPSPKEGWGLCVTEAAACGTPSVASNSPGLREAVRDGETGFLVPHGEIPVLAGKIQLLLQDNPLRERMSGAAYQWAQQFSWDATASQSLQVLQEAAKR
jgi:glycosyltransferase involved in cell wall biosynthesis